MSIAKIRTQMETPSKSEINANYSQPMPNIDIIIQDYSILAVKLTLIIISNRICVVSLKLYENTGCNIERN